MEQEHPTQVTVTANLAAADTKDNKGIAEVYGTMKGTFSEDEQVIILFDHDKSNAVKVRVGQNIPLDMNQAPETGDAKTFNIHADLTDSGTGHGIAKGDAVFTVDKKNGGSKIINGPLSGSIVVSVNCT